MKQYTHERPKRLEKTKEQVLGEAKKKKNEYQ